MKFRYVFIKRWEVKNFRFTFFPSMAYSGKSDLAEKKRVFSLRWLCFGWHFEWYKERNNNINII